MSLKLNFGGFMSIPKFKRKPSRLDYVDNAFELLNMYNLKNK